MSSNLYMPPSKQADPLLSILILTYNDGKYLDDCLKSIEKQISFPCEVILVHNGSSEPLPGGIETRYPWLRVILSARNLGFNGGNNLAARSARSKYVLLLNIDTVLLTDVIQPLRILESDPRIGIVGAQSCAPSGETRPTTGRFPRAWRLWLFRKLWSKPAKLYQTQECLCYKVDWVEGSFFMVRASDWKTLGGFDERNPLFGNDIDFCRAAAERGLVVLHCPTVRYVHFGGYRVSRVGHLYAGFLGYHAKFSGPIERLLADVILKAGLVARILVYGFWYLITRDHQVEDKWRKFANVYKGWAQIAL